MMHRQRLGVQTRTARRSFAPFLAAMLLVVACKQLGFLQAELPDDGPPIVTSMDAAKSYIEKVKAAGEIAAATKQLSLDITQEEVTSFLSIGSEIREKLREQDVQSFEELEGQELSPELQQIEGLQEWLELLQGQGDTPLGELSDLGSQLGLRELEVYFKAEGHVIIRGYVEALGQRQPLRLVVAPQASEGKLVLDFVEGQLGPASIPESLLDQIDVGVANLILAADASVAVTEVRVTDGGLAVRGVARD